MFRLILLFLLMLPPNPRGVSDATWGFYMHRQINRTAIFTLPPEMIVFYKRHINQLMHTAVDPDKRRYVVPQEPPRHFIDLDRYADSLFMSWEEASSTFGENFLLENGIVPWHIARLQRALVTSFRLGDGASILRLSSDLGHYIGDAHVPLHTTSNYDGEETKQEGIHALWETRLPELFFEEYDLFTGKAVLLDDPFMEIMKSVHTTHRLVDSVLRLAFGDRIQ